MKYILITGPQAVGKMTVGEELEKLTGLKLFHNHATIDYILQYFTWAEGTGLIQKLREDIMRKYAELKKGMIHTLVWAFDMESDWEYVEKNHQIFEGYDRYYVELYSDLDTRLERNITENRLEKKWTKRDTEWSNNEMKKTMEKHRLTSNPGEVHYGNYIKIDNTNLSAKETALKIIEHFNLI